jgi:hypothetical protein
MPVVRDVMNQLGKFEWISVIDLADSYHQFRLKKEDQPKTAFTLDGKQYMFTVVPFGLKIMTGHMQRIMEQLLEELNIRPFQDDIAIASLSKDEHVRLVKQVLEKITYGAGLRIRLKKCKFFRTEARVLGMLATREGIKMDPQKVDSILKWPKPNDGKAMQRFLGAANFNREFSHQFAKIAAPLEECRNLKVIEWTEVRVKAFEELKKLFASNILLHHIDWGKKVYLTTDASQFGIGAWIGQIDQRGKLVPVICASRKLSSSEQRWPATKRELYGLMWAMKKFRHYLLGRHFVARVDHKPLVALLKNKMTMLTEGWMETIMEYSFSTEYLPGEKNSFADALSRSFAVNSVSVEDQAIAKMEWEAELRGCQLLGESLRLGMIERTHAMGHFGGKSIFQKIIKQGFWWPRMRNDIDAVIKKCDQCLCYNVQKEGFHPAKSIIAKNPWDHIQIDLVGPLPMSEEGFTNILTIVDVCSNYTVVRPLRNKDMETIGRELWKVFADYGTPKILQSDNGTEFVNQVLDAMRVVYGIDHCLITAYHPRANGLVERRNKEVSRALRKFCEGTFGAWQDWLPLVQISLNDAVSERTGTAAFSLMFGQKFNDFHDFSNVELPSDTDKVFVDVKQHWDQFKKLVLPAIEKKTKAVKAKQEENLNTTRKQVGCLQPGTKVMAIDSMRSSKWEAVYEGPFTVVRQTRGGAYVLKNELGEEMSPKRTIEMLKVIDDTTVEEQHDAEDELQPKSLSQKSLEDSDKIYEVEDIVAHRMKNGKYEYKVKWKGYKTKTWEPYSNFNGNRVVTDYWRRFSRKKKKEKKLATVNKK